MKKFIYILFLFSISINCFASYNPTPTRLFVSARYVHGATVNVLSAMTIGYVDQGLAYLQGTCSSSTSGCTGVVAPQNGTYTFIFNGWVCGVGTNEQEVTDTRGGSTIVYDQTKKYAAGGNCEVGSMGIWTVPNVLSGDIITFKLNENNTGTTINSITNNTSQTQGSFTAFYLQTYP